MADYKCLNCNELLDEDELDYVSNRYGEYYKRERVCPYCKSNDIEGLKECPYCDEVILESEDCCEECAEAFNSAIDIHRMFKTSEHMETAGIEINPYLAEMFSTKEINEILFAHLKEAAFSSVVAAQKVINTNQRFIKENAAEFIVAYKEVTANV